MVAHRLAFAAVAALLACTACNELDRTRWSARLGSADAQLALGERLAAGDGVEKNLDEALVWLEKAAEDGSVPAQMRLVELYGERGAPEDAARAERWLRAAAEAGDARAQVMLAERILAAGGDDAEAAKWIARSAEAGDPRGQLAQARRLAREPGKEAEVLALLTRAAEQGDPDAAWELARVAAGAAGVDAEALIEVAERGGRGGARGRAARARHALCEWHGRCGGPRPGADLVRALGGPGLCGGSGGARTRLSDRSAAPTRARPRPRSGSGSPPSRSGPRR